MICLLSHHAKVTKVYACPHAYCLFALYSYNQTEVCNDTESTRWLPGILACADHLLFAYRPFNG